MSDVQINDFQSRVDRITHNHPHNYLRKKQAPIKRNSFGEIVMPKTKKEYFKWMMFVRPLLLLYISFTIFKAVLIYNSDHNDYTQILANLEAGDNKSQIVAFTMAPGYFTEPVGVFVSGIVNKLNQAQKK